jgi:hypothetical protein
MICTFCRRRVGRALPTGMGAVCPRCGEIVVGAMSIKVIQQSAEECVRNTMMLAVWWGLQRAVMV